MSRCTAHACWLQHILLAKKTFSAYNLHQEVKWRLTTSCSWYTKRVLLHSVAIKTSDSASYFTYIIPLRTWHIAMRLWTGSMGLRTQSSSGLFWSVTNDKWLLSKLTALSKLITYRIQNHNIMWSRRCITNISQQPYVQISGQITHI